MKYCTNREEIKRLVRGVTIISKFKVGEVKISTNVNDNTENVGLDDEKICKDISEGLLSK